MLYSVLGLGESLKDFDGEGITIGVNDIYRYHKTKYVVCVDPKRKFEGDRLRFIEECRPISFFSQLNEYATNPSFQKITLLSPRGTVAFFQDKVPYSLFSPFVAICLAINMGASEVRVYGVDLINHWNLGIPSKTEQCIKHLKVLIAASPVPIKFCLSSPIRFLNA